MTKKILIIDDEASAMASIMDYLSHEGFESEIATNLLKALETLKSRKFDALIVDCVLATGHEFLESRLAGVHLIEKIRSGSPEILRENRNVPIIVLTAVCDRETLRDLNNSDVQAVFQKPMFNIEELIETLHSVVKKK